jgi:quercetin dioxygenase-like cupin family protein
MFMALAPGEAFQHTHVEYSITTLREGAVELEIDGARTQLVQGMPTPVDANVTHRMINVGPIIARVECGHLQGEPPTA